MCIFTEFFQALFAAVSGIVVEFAPSILTALFGGLFG